MWPQADNYYPHRPGRLEPRHAFDPASRDNERCCNKPKDHRVHEVAETASSERKQVNA